MSKRSFSVLAVAVCLFISLAVGKFPLRTQPARPILDSDIVGAWSYEKLRDENGDDGWIVTIEFRDDGSCRQTLVPPRARNLIRQTSRWRIEGATVKIDSLIAWDEWAEGHWARSNQTWRVVESTKRPGALAVRGGLAADHSMDHELEKLSDAECRLLTSVAPVFAR